MRRSELNNSKVVENLSAPAHGQVKQYCFTLIELLFVTSQLCRDFFKRFICTDKYGCVRKHTENAAHKNTPLFLKEKSSCAKAMEENGNRKRKLRCRRSAFSREKKFACPLASHPFTLIELLVTTAQQNCLSKKAAYFCEQHSPYVSVHIRTYPYK